MTRFSCKKLYNHRRNKTFRSKTIRDIFLSLYFKWINQGDKVITIRETLLKNVFHPCSAFASDIIEEKILKKTKTQTSLSSVVPL